MERQDEQTTGARAAEDNHADIYGEDGVILSSFLAQIGAAIADRDTLTLKREVDDCTNRNSATCSKRSTPNSAARWSNFWAPISTSPR